MLDNILEQLTYFRHFAFICWGILIIDVLIYKISYKYYAEIYGRREARKQAYGNGWMFLLIALPLVTFFWWIV